MIRLLIFVEKNKGKGGGKGGGGGGFHQQKGKRDGDWICSSCNNNNFANRDNCNRCNLPKNSSAGPTTPQGTAAPSGFPTWQQPAQQPQAPPSWGPKPVEQQQSRPEVETRPSELPPEFPSMTAKAPQPSANPPAQDQPSNKQKKKNKYPKKEPEAPKPAPTSTVSLTQQAGDMQIMSSAPGTKSLSQIESNPNGAVYQGTRGQKCKLEVNYLKIAVNSLISKAFHYDVEFVPDVPKKMLPKALEAFMKKFFGSTFYAFDGRKNFYTNQLLAVKGVTLDGSYEQEVEALLGDRKKTFKVKVQYATEIDLSVLKNYTHPSYQHNDKPSQAIQCLDVVLRTAFKPATEAGKAVGVGRALYFANENPKQYPLGEGMEMWLGLFQSAVLGRAALYLNVDVAHKAFPSAIPVLDVLASFDRYGKVPTKLENWQQKQLIDFMKLLSVGYRLNPNEPIKTFGFNGLAAPARTATFVDDKGTKMTVMDYFQRVKNYKLRFPDLPTLHVGSKIRNIYLPIELCMIPAGQATNKKCTPGCVAQMIKYSATTTDERKQKIQRLLNQISYGDNEVKGFGINVDKNFQNVEGRVIDPPTLKYQDGTVKPSRGVWNGKKFLENSRPGDAGTAIKWAIINCDRTSDREVHDLSNNIMKGARPQGMNMAPFDMSRDYVKIDISRDDRDIEKFLQKFYDAKYQLVFVIISDRNDCYAKVKQAAELRVGILTQCIKSNTIFRMGKGNPMMTIGNILLKVNAKLNGKNQEIIETSYNQANSPSSGVMFVGADVTHPSPDQRDIPSVVGVAASYDAVGFRYQCAWRLQDPKKEMIEDLENILVEQFMYYKSKNGGRLPGKLMYYRDGVSEGQFLEVREFFLCI